jgi:hypothetical protein
MAAQLAGMPEGFLEVARRTLADLEGEGREVENGEGVAARG